VTTKEAQLISAVCKNKDIARAMSANIDDLFVTHKDVWDGLKAYYQKYGAAPDITIIEKKFMDFEGDESVGKETDHYIDELRNHYVNNAIETIIRDELEKHGKIPGSRLLERLQGRLTKLSRYANVVHDVDITDFEEAAHDYEARKRLAAEHGGSPGISTGFKAIDAFYPTGLAGGHFIVIIGWSGKGKTAFSSLLAVRAWRQGYKPMIVSLEMSAEQMRDRIYTVMGDGMFSHNDLQRGKINLESFNNWGSRNLADKQPFIIVDTEGVDSVTPATLQAKYEQHKPDLIIADYIQLFDSVDQSKGEVDRIRSISRDLKSLAIRNNIPVLGLTQATQQQPSDTEEPAMIAQVTGSKGIQHDADLAIAAHRYDDSNMMAVIGRKNRHGPLFEFAIDWDMDSGVLEEHYG
jgi:replicative DNA helicase